jgi:hypothetical protein
MFQPVAQAASEPTRLPHLDDSPKAVLDLAALGLNDLPLALTATCAALGTSPDAGTHHADYQKVDQLLDAAEQSVRQSFESAPELAADRRLQAVCNLVGAWSINSARDLAWTNSLLLWPSPRTSGIAGKSEFGDVSGSNLRTAGRFRPCLDGPLMPLLPAECGNRVVVSRGIRH